MEKCWFSKTWKRSFAAACFGIRLRGAGGGRAEHDHQWQVIMMMMVMKMVMMVMVMVIVMMMMIEVLRLMTLMRKVKDDHIRVYHDAKQKEHLHKFLHQYLMSTWAKFSLLGDHIVISIRWSTLSLVPERTVAGFLILRCASISRFDRHDSFMVSQNTFLSLQPIIYLSIIHLLTSDLRSAPSFAPRSDPRSDLICHLMRYPIWHPMRYPSKK